VSNKPRSVVHDGDVTWQKIADEIGLSRQGAMHVYRTAIRKLEKNKKLKQYWVDQIAEGSRAR